MFKTTRIAGYATYLIAFLAFALSYSKLFDLAERAGYSNQMAHLWPLIVDGLAVIATIGVLRLRKSGYAWFLLLAATLVSVIAAVASAMFPAGALPPVAAALVSVVPPLCLLFAPHLAVQLIREAQEQDATSLEVEEVEVAESNEEADAVNLESKTPAFNVEVGYLNATQVATIEDAPKVAVAPVPDVAPTLDLQLASESEVEQIATVTTARPTDEQRNEALQLVQDTTMSIRAIAKQVGVTDTTVHRWMKQAGIQRKRQLVRVG